MTPRLAAVALAVAAAKRGTLRGQERAVHQAADKHLTKIQVAVLAAFSLGRKAWRATRDPAKASAAVRKALGQTLQPALLAAMTSGGEAALGEMKGLRALADGPITTRFDASDPLAVAWAKEHAAELAKDLSDTTEQDIQDAVAQAMEDGDYDELSDAILAAVGDDARAELIARTESMLAANEGQRQGWGQAVEDGLLPEDATVEWIATAGCCDDCDALDGTTRPVNGEYDDADAGDGPPLHPACRCTEGISG